MKNADGRALARENEVRVLRALHRFGWLRTRDVAALTWLRWSGKPPNAGPSFAPATPTPAALRMAQRTLRRMREAKLLLQGQGPDGSVLYALSEAGARALQGLGVEASSGKDLMRAFSTSHFRHRCIANEVAIGAIIEGFRASSEREISQGRWLGGEAGIAGKRPDALLRAGPQLWWVEVERSRKNAKDYARLLTWLRKVLHDAERAGPSELLPNPNRWSKVVFVSTRAFRAKLLHDLTAMGVSVESIEKAIIFETCLYTMQDINFS